jgi:hypothetical protein
VLTGVELAVQVAHDVFRYFIARDELEQAHGVLTLALALREALEQEACARRVGGDHGRTL